jgi:predicted PhzF superfamily epimerase YddE/YHI9
MYIQGEAMGRPSVIRAELRKDDAAGPDGAGNPDGDVCIRVGGSAAVLAEGELYL